MRRLANTATAAFLLAGGFSTPAPSQADPAVGHLPIALVGAEVRTVSQGTFALGVVVVEGGKISAVGAEGDVAIPPGSRVRDLRGKVLIPGIVDTHSHIGIAQRPAVAAHADTNDNASPVNANLRAIDAIWPDDPGIRMANAGGVTTANIMPGSGSVVSGQTAYVKLRGNSVEEMLVLEGPVVGGMKMANGENPKRGRLAKQKSPGTRMGIAGLQRDLFVRALAYREKLAAHAEKMRKGDASEPPPRDLELEPVVEILDGRRTVHHHTHRSDDILTVLRLRREFGFDLVLQHATEAWRVTREIAEAGVPVSAIVLDSPGGKLEASRYRLAYAGELERAGVSVAIHSDDFIGPSRLLLRGGGLAIRGGMSEEGALRALTLNGAKMLRLDDRLGSIDVGKDADLVVLSGPPFSVYTRVLETWIDGVRVFDRANPADRRYATGGFAVGDAYPSLESSP